MRLGCVFPTYEIEDDPGAVRAFVQAAEGLGYDHVVVFDHVLGANPASRPGWRWQYGLEHTFHELFTTLAFMAAATTRIELASAVLVLPLRQTALVAKQAAEVDWLSGGRLRLGVGIGWNEVEFAAMGEDFRTRGRRMEEQIEVLRRLWTEESVTFKGRWHAIEDAGLRPLPRQRPIPIWIGAHAGPAIERAARLADGWFPLFTATGKAGSRVPGLGDDDPARIVASFREAARKAGRDPAALGLDGRQPIGGRSPDEWAADAAAWRGFGATHLTVRSIHAGLARADEHIDLIRRFRESGAALA